MPTYNWVRFTVAVKYLTYLRLMFHQHLDDVIVGLLSGKMQRCEEAVWKIEIQKSLLHMIQIHVLNKSFEHRYWLTHSLFFSLTSAPFLSSNSQICFLLG